MATASRDSKKSLLYETQNQETSEDWHQMIPKFQDYLGLVML